MQSSKDYLLGIAGIIIASIVWGTTGTAATFAPEVSAAAIGAAAMGIGGLLQAALAFKGIATSTHALKEQRHYLALGAVAVAIYPLAFYASMRMAGVTIGTVITIGSAPLLSALIEYKLDGLRLSKRWVVGALTGILGMALLSLAEGSTTHASATSNAAMAGILLGLLAGFTYALYSWCARRVMQSGISSTTAMGAMFGLGGLLLMPVLALTGSAFLTSWNNAAVGIYMAIIPMFIGYVCFGYGLSRVQASIATTITLFEPVVAAFLAVLIVGERLPLLGWAGVILIIACLIIITIPLKPRRSVPAAVF